VDLLAWWTIIPGDAVPASGDAIGPAINPSARPASSSANRSRLRRSRPPGGGAGGRERTGAMTQDSGVLPGAVTQRDPTGTGYSSAAEWRRGRNRVGEHRRQGRCSREPRLAEVK